MLFRSLWLDSIRSKVPLEKQVEAAPSVAGPALRAMIYLEDDNPMLEMFVNLLSAAINVDTKKLVHPGLVTALEQMHPDESVLIRKFTDAPFLGVQGVHHLDGDRIGRMSSKTSFPQEGFSEPDSLYMYFEHLAALNLLNYSPDLRIKAPQEELKKLEGLRWYSLSMFGSRFLQVCGQAPSPAHG